MGWFDVRMSFFVKMIEIFEEKRREAFLLFDSVEEREQIGLEARVHIP